MADVSASLFNKAKNFICGIFQQGKAPIDSDINDSRQSLYSHIEDLGRVIGMEGCVGNGWKVVAWPSIPANNFGLTAGYAWHQGLRCYLAETSGRRPDTGTIPNLNLSSVISSVQALVLADLRANFTIDEHIGKTLAVWRKAGGPILTYTITTNQATTITVSPGDDMLSDGISELDHYCILPSTPTVSDRTDLVVLNVYTDEVSSTEDESIAHTIGGVYEGERRLKIRTVVEVVEGVDPAAPLSSLPADYVDMLGNSHSYLALATIARVVGVSTILTGDIIDLRTPFYALDQYLPLAGGTMLGDIDMKAQVITGNAAEIDFDAGDVVVDNDVVAAQHVVVDANGEETVYLDCLNSSTVPPTPVAQIRARADDELARIQAKYPKDSDDLTTKEYVDEKMSSHTHSQYLTRDSINMNSLSNLTDLCELAYGAGHTYLEQNEYVDWAHGLANPFLRVQVQYSPTGGSFPDMWVDATGVLDWAIVDEDTIRIFNGSATTIAGSRIRVCAMLADFQLDSYLEDTLISGLFTEKITVSVS